jgi:hypothetical protein
MSIEDYKYLWDGSQPGWELQHHDHTDWYLVFEFTGSGPSKEEIANMHKCVPELREEKLPHVYRILKGTSSFRTSEPVGNIEAREMHRTARELDLKVTMEAQQISSYLPIYKEKQVLLIEDGDLSQQIAKKMIEAGVPVVEVHID